MDTRSCLAITRGWPISLVIHHRRAVTLQFQLILGIDPQQVRIDKLCIEVFGHRSVGDLNAMHLDPVSQVRIGQRAQALVGQCEPMAQRGVVERLA